VATSPKIYVVDVGVFTHFWTLLKGAFQICYEDGCFGIAKGAAYSSLLAFFPVITTTATLLVQANAQAVSRTVARLLYDVVPPGTEAIVQALFNVKGQQPTALLVTAILVSLFAGSGVMMSLMEGFRAIYRIPSSRSFLHERLVAMMLVLVTALPALGASALIVFSNRIRRLVISWLGLAPGGKDLTGWVELAGQAITVSIAVGTIIIIAVLVYYFGPNRKQSLRQLLPGAVLATTLWLISTSVFGWYVEYIGHYNVLYGSVGAGLALLVWSYVLAVVVLFGCAYNAVREWRQKASLP
jgi:membrane protein